MGSNADALPLADTAIVAGTVRNGPSNAPGLRLLPAAGELSIRERSAASGDERWSDIFSAVSGLDGPVRALVTDSFGTLYVGGSFTSAGRIKANNIARWDGSSWSRLGSGLNGEVLALVLDQRGNLYAGGRFTTAGTAAANHVAKWNGSFWVAVGGGMSSTVFGLGMDGSGSLYAGSGEQIYRWNGASWLSLGYGYYSYGGYVADVESMTADSRGNVFVAGYDGDGMSDPEFNLHWWDGAFWSRESACGGEWVERLPTAFAADTGGSLYANLGCGSIEVWNGENWRTVATGIGSSLYEDSAVRALAADGQGNIYAAGPLTMAGGIAANHVAGWNGSSWSALGSGVDGDVYALAMGADGSLFVGGVFSHAGGKTSQGIAEWSAQPALAATFSSKPGLDLRRGTGWKHILDGSPSHVTVRGSKLIASLPGDGIHEYDGSSWQMIRGSSNVQAILGVGDKLFVSLGAQGFYLYDGILWSQIAPVSPRLMIRRGNNLAASFDDGLFEYKCDARSWLRISERTQAEQMVAVQHVLYVDFGASGLYKYDGQWTRIRLADPGRMTQFGGTLAVTFAGLGIYQYDGKSWKRLSSKTDTENLLASIDGLFADRGEAGLYKYRNGWRRVSRLNAGSMCLYGGRLVASFEHKGLRRYTRDGWEWLSSDDTAEEMTGLFFW